MKSILHPPLPPLPGRKKVTLPIPRLWRLPERVLLPIEEYNEHSCKGHKPVASNTDDNPNPGPLTQGRMVMVNGMMATESGPLAVCRSMAPKSARGQSNRNPMLKGEYPSFTQSPAPDDAKVGIRIRLTHALPQPPKENEEGWPVGISTLNRRIR